MCTYLHDSLLPCHATNIPLAKLLTLACTHPFQMTGNLENLVRQKVMFLCPVTWYNFCLTNCRLGQDKLLFLFAECKHRWRGGVCRLCARPASSSFTCHAEEGAASHSLSHAGWQSGRNHLACFSLILGLRDSSGAEWSQHFKPLWEYSLPTV